MNRRFRMLMLSCGITLGGIVVPAPSPAQAKDPITAIRQHYVAINKLAGKYRKVQKELSGSHLKAAS